MRDRRGRAAGDAVSYRTEPSLSAMIDHFGVPAADPAAAAAFYTTVFAPLGLHEAMRFDTPAAR